VKSRHTPPGPELSVIVPAFNEAQRIGASLEKIIRFLDAREAPSEILVIDDGSTDRTAELAASFGHPNLRVIRNSENRGKGYSVRRGFAEAAGRWVLFTDADLSTPIEELDQLLDRGREGADVVIGSRAIDRSKILVHQSRLREFGGIVFNKFVRLVLRLPIADTQCGFKLFRRDKCAPVFARQRIEGFGFDPEVLYLARKGGFVIEEVPVTWKNDQASKVRFLQDAVTMFLNLVQIRWNWIAGQYRGIA
jgi:dolichyl-phosphate beta-glucosyltransferase